MFSKEYLDYIRKQYDIVNTGHNPAQEVLNMVPTLCDKIEELQKKINFLEVGNRKRSRNNKANCCLNKQHYEELINEMFFNS